MDSYWILLESRVTNLQLPIFNCFEETFFPLDPTLERPAELAAAATRATARPAWRMFQDASPFQDGERLEKLDAVRGALLCTAGPYKDAQKQVVQSSCAMQ